MIGLIELNDIAVETDNSKCITSSETEGTGKVKVIIYKKCMENICQLNLLIVSSIAISESGSVNLTLCQDRQCFI